MENYLYGFTIHSIQGYIFQTNKLKEIAGASELVEQIATTEFAKMINKDFEDFNDDASAIRNAAGNIRYLFEDEKICRKVVKEFPKIVLEFAPGVQISQAVVMISNNEEFKTKVEELELKLTAQRNNPFRPVDLGYMAINRSRRTGFPSVEREKSLGDVLINDRVTKHKQDVIDNQNKFKIKSRINQSFFGSELPEEMIPREMENIVFSKNSESGWLAVIHADGNNMGQALKNLEKEVDGEESYSVVAKKFSQAIDQSTKAAASIAFNNVYPTKPNEGEFVPFRPIILGGDDLTIVCRADLALKFTQCYLEEFENQTKANFKNAKLDSLENGLTACAGIAFIKVSYPFFYAADLAEALCSHAKKDAKTNKRNSELTPSCLMFHKVQDSFVENYTDIIERELTAHSSNIRFDFGPYYLKSTNEKPTIDQLFNAIAQIKGKEGNAIKSGLRQWLTDLHANKEKAEQRMKRLLSVGNEKILKDLNLKNTQGIISDKSPVYDWLTIMSINQNSKSNDNN